MHASHIFVFLSLRADIFWELELAESMKWDIKFLISEFALENASADARMAAT